MKVAYSLSLKISLWLLLNLLLLAVLGIGFFVVQGGLGWNALVVGFAGDRAQAKANVIGGEAAAVSGAQRDAVLARLGAAYHAELFLVRSGGEQIAGAKTAFPAEVVARTESMMPGRGPRGDDFGPPRGGRGPRDDFGPNAGEPWRGRGPDGFPRAGGPGAPGGRGSVTGGRDEPAGAPGFNAEMTHRDPPNPLAERERGRFLLRVGSPASYWIGLRAPFIPPERGQRLGPPILIARINSLWGVLRFLEFEPWLLAGTVVLGLSFLFWLPLVRGITHAIGQLTRATEKIAEGRFETRVPERRRDELGTLGASVNRMAARLDAHMNGQKRFLGDVAHELCSPLARLQMATGILTDQAPENLRGTVSDVREEVQQMSALVNELLAFTKAGLQPRAVECAPLELAPLVHATLEREGATSVNVVIPAGTRIVADADLFSRAFGNLVRNALRYAGAASLITVTVRRAGDRVNIAVEDEGPGVPPEAIDRLGEPFFRPEAARTREGGGVGLGLSIVRNSVAACGGEVRFANRTPRGFRAELIFAAAS